MQQSDTRSFVCVCSFAFEREKFFSFIFSLLNLCSEYGKLGDALFIALISAVIGKNAFWFKKKFSYFEGRVFGFVKSEPPFRCLQGDGYKILFPQKTKTF